MSWTRRKVCRRDLCLVPRTRPVLDSDRLSIERRVGCIDDISYANHQVGAVYMHSGPATEPVTARVQAAPIELFDIGPGARRQDDEVCRQPIAIAQEDSADVIRVHVEPAYSCASQQANTICFVQIADMSGDSRPERPCCWNR